MKISFKQAQSKFPEGTRVKYAREFLRNIAAHTGDMPRRTGTVVSEVFTYSPTFHIVRVRWDDEKPDDELHGVNCSNLVPVASLHLEPA